MAAKKSAKKKTLGRKKTKGATAEASSKARTYDPNASYKKGELIFHPKWNDEGPVIDVGKTTDGLEKVTVDFAELGPKRLVMNYDLKI